MRSLILGITCAIYVVHCNGIEFIDVPEADIKKLSPARMLEARRSYWIKNFGEHNVRKSVRQAGYEDEKDANLKMKISTLVDQTIYDTDRKIKSVKSIKEHNRELLPYKIGFILSMVKKSRDVLNELFNIAVKHRDEWKALEQLKIFELIVHTNVDTTNLVRQLVELHIQNLNTTHTRSGRRVVVLK